MNGEARLVRHPRTLHRTLPDCVLLVAPGDRRPLRLTGAAAPVWILLEQPRTRDEIAASAAAESGLDPSLATALVDDSLALLMPYLATLADSQDSAP